MSLADRVARLEGRFKAGDERLIVIVRSFARAGAAGAPIQRLRCGSQVWERRDDEGDDDFTRRVRSEVQANPGGSLLMFVADG
mgnify:CR=1 FL=1